MNTFNRCMIKFGLQFFPKRTLTHTLHKQMLTRERISHVGLSHIDDSSWRRVIKKEFSSRRGPQLKLTMSVKNEHVKPNSSAEQQHLEQEITPWDVRGEVIEGVEQAIDYEKLMKQFGCQPLSNETIARMERLTGKQAHILIRRGVFYCHRDFNHILDLYEQGKPFYLYTGRGPSSESMHVGHMIPFLTCKYLQEIFDCHLVIQMTDDEKFLFKDLKLEEVQKYTVENSKDIIAVGFNPEKTFIFANSQYYGYMFDTILRIQKLVNVNQSNNIFGFDETCSVGKLAYPCAQIAPSFSAAFPHLFGGKKDVPCLIPYAIDQDPYFRIGRDIAPRLKYLKSASLCSSFFPALQGFHSKMSSSTENSAIFMTDTGEQIKRKVNKYAFSGGGDTAELHHLYGANLDVDVPYQYLRFFLEDDEELERIRIEYKAGRMMTGDIKAICIRVLTEFVEGFQKRRAAITPKLYKQFTQMPGKTREEELVSKISQLEAELNALKMAKTSI